MAHAIRTKPAHHVANLTMAVLAAWFLLAIAGSLLGVFDSEPNPPIPLGLAAFLPVAVFGFCYQTSSSFRQFVLSLDMRVLTMAQAWRVAGIVFVILYHQRALPGVFALPAGWGDIAVGLTAPLIAWYWKRPIPRAVFVAWNVLGVVDLLLAVTLGVLASATPIGVLAEDATTGLMGRFPLSLIPTFFVPLFLILHLICLSRVRNEEPLTSPLAST